MYELIKLKIYLLEKIKIIETEFGELLKILFKKTHLVPLNKYMSKIPETIKLMGNIDRKDIPFIAIALVIKNNGIWTSDKHFTNKPK